MIRFNCDYSEGAHEKVLERLIATNREQTQGYGTDHYSVQAKELIRRLCGRMDADVHFLVGGTQANLTVISAGLRPYQGVIAADTGHINVHETGAIEACGHKILALPSSDGKITAGQVEVCCQHMVRLAAKHTETMETVNIRYSPKWYIFPNLRSLGRFTAKKNWRRCRKPVRETDCFCSWTGPGWDMPWLRRGKR